MILSKPLSKPLPTPLCDPFEDDLRAVHPRLRLRVSNRAKRLALRLDPKTGYVFLVMPRRASINKAIAFATEYRDWIDRHATAIPDTIPLTHGTVLPVMGADRRIDITIDPAIKRTTVTLGDDVLTVHTNKDDPSGRIVRFLKALARDEITRLAHDKAALIDRTPSAIRIGDTSSRWGSCSADGALSFSWRLILAPATAMDYVVAHEVAHLIHMNHKTRFWSLCEKLSTDFHGGHGWMKKNGHTLMRYV